MSEYLTEQEQIELLKNWFKQYSLVIIAGIVIAVVAITSWRYWQERQIKILTHASGVYEELLLARAQNDSKNMVIQANKILKHYPKTPYSQVAAFLIAQQAVKDKNYHEASLQLNWVLDNSKIPSIRQIARLRLARVLIADKHPKESIETLMTIDDKNFLGMIEEVKGDAFLALNNKHEAREAYRKALTELPNAEVIRPVLQMKFDHLADTSL